jgi:hypothetical protein
LRGTIKDFGALFAAVDIDVPHSVLAYHSEFREADPAPVHCNIWNLSLLELLASIDVEDLNNCLVASSCSNGDYVALFVHKNAVGLHISSVDFEVLGGVDDCDLLKV